MLERAVENHLHNVYCTYEDNSKKDKLLVKVHDDVSS